jgi:hypothetical protein
MTFAIIGPEERALCCSEWWAVINPAGELRGAEELCPGIVFRDKFHPVPYDKRQDEIARPFNLVAHYYRKCQLCPHPWS